MSRSWISHLRLTSFKSYQDITLPLSMLTVLIGRNGSGKSNALDALEALSRLARADEVRDALDGTRGMVGPVRGGGEGCAPHGSHSFEIGATIKGDDGFAADLDVAVQVSPRPEIVQERLVGTVKGKRHELVQTEPADPNRSDLRAHIWNGNKSKNPVMAFRSSHLLTSQLPLRLAGETDNEQALVETAQRVLGVLSGVFHLDPIPHLMRQYVPEQDNIMRRTGENVSAAIARLKRDDAEGFARLVRVIKELPAHEIRSVEVGKGQYGEVMVALKERKGRGSVTVPARQMSDGMLRMLAIVTALLSGGTGLALDNSALAPSPALMLVIEELENGLHPSQAARVLELVKQSSADRGFQVVITTHSPALLNALSGDDHIGVILIARDRTSGLSHARSLVDVPGYLALMARERLGDAVTRDDLAKELPAQPDFSDLNRLLGIG